jgi:drug/metabolite transporter (DMT)-like permease
MGLLSSSRSSEHAKAIWMLVLANFFWGISFPTIKALGMIQEGLVPGGGSWFVTAMTVAPRFLIAFAVLLFFQARRLSDTSSLEMKQGLILGFFASSGMFFQNDGLQFTEASTSAFLTQLYAILIPVWLALNRRRNPGLRVWLCCALVLAGVSLLGHFNWRSMSFGRGEVETLISSVFYMGQILCLNQTRFADNRPERVTLVMFGVQFAFAALFTWVTAPSLSSILIPWSSPSWVVLTCVLAVFCTICAFLLMNFWQPKISATQAGLTYCIEPVFGSLLALCLPALYSGWSGICYPNEIATWHLLVGGGLITVANVLLNLPKKQPVAA